jgi:hypothetical protein
VETRLAYLAGIIDGEGCIGLSRGSINKSGYYRISSFINIANTDPRLILECVNILKDIGVNCNITQNSRKSLNVLKPVWVIKIGGHKRIIKVLDNIEKYLVSKKDQSLLMRKFISQRFNGGLTNPYTDLDNQVVEEMHILKIKTIPFSESVETKRFAPLVGGVIVRTDRKLSEEAEMTSHLVRGF